VVSISLSASGKLDKSGGTLTGPLILERDPLGDLEAATRRWVLAQVGTGGGGGVQIAADLGGTDAAPLVIGTHLAAPLPLAQGGTNAADAPTARAQLGLGTAATANTSAFDPAGAAVAAQTAAISAAAANAAGTYLPLTGGTLTGPLALGNHKVTGVANGTAATDVAALGQVPTVGAAGAGAGVALSSTDATTTNARTPTAHATVHATGGSDPLTPAAIGAAATSSLGGAAFLAVGTTAGTVAAGDDSRITGAVQSAGTGLTKTGTSLALATPVSIANGGTGQASAQAALNALAGAQTLGRYLRGDGTNVTLAAIQAADVPILNQSTTGTAAGLSSTLAIASGGTGATSAATALVNLGAVASDWCDLLGVALLTAKFTESGVTYQQTPGDLVLCLCTPPKTKSISSLAAWVTAGGVTPSGVNALMFFDETGNLIDQTGDMSSAWSSAGMVEGALGGSHTVTAGVGYYLGFLTHFSGTSPHFAATGTAGTANFPLANGHRTAIFKGGQTSVPLSIDPSSYTPNSGYFIMYGR